MIKINLLPFRIARRKENIRQQISIFCLTIFLVSVVLFWYAQHMNTKIATVKEETKQVNAQIAKFKEKAVRVEKIKKDLKALDEKLIIVASLNEQRNEQLFLSDSLTQLIIPGRMWLSNLKINKDTVTISGVAYDNPTIADFMEQLEKSSFFNKIDLKAAKIKKFKDGVILKSFEVLCRKDKNKQAKKEPKKQGKK